MPRYFTLVFFLFSILSQLNAYAIDETAARQQLVSLIKDDVRRTRAYIDKETLAPRVIRAIAEIPRHSFVPSDQRQYAYENRPLPIGHGQTISQPFIVALMTDLLEVEATDKVLEIGTGSGYQAAVLAHLAEHVYSIEIIPALGEQAAARLQRLGYDNITTKIGDGYYGWESAGPFDAIIVTAAAGHIPPPLIRQLSVGGRMMIPIGSAFQTQQLLLVTRESADRVTTRQVLPVIFVPLTGSH
jgi:protein-L-isoaspartate(D-aspartate) O-methyltransferase